MTNEISTLFFSLLCKTVLTWTREHVNPRIKLRVVVFFSPAKFVFLHSFFFAHKVASGMQRRARTLTLCGTMFPIKCWKRALAKLFTLLSLHNDRLCFDYDSFIVNLFVIGTFPFLGRIFSKWVFVVFFHHVLLDAMNIDLFQEVCKYYWLGLVHNNLVSLYL